MFTLKLIFAGLSVGAIYSLIALGFNITFWTSKVLNFGYGSFIMFTSMVLMTLVTNSINWFFSIIIAFLMIMILGMALERVSVRPLLKFPTSMGWIVSTLGFGLFLEALATVIWGGKAVTFPNFIFSSTDYISVFGVKLSLQYLMVLVVAIVVMGILDQVVNKTIWGKAMKAVSYDAEYSKVMGIKSEKVIVISFIVSALLAGIAGLLIAPIQGTITPGFGMNLMILGFVAAVLGGMGSSKGALIGGLSLGIIEKLVGGFISSSLEQSVAFAILILILALKPSGILGVREVQKV